MNKIRLTIVVWATLLTLSVYAQQNIERMLPAFATLENIKVTESIDNGTWSQYEAPFYSVKIENVPIEMIPSWLVDSLIIAFEKELPLATESDRYQKHSEQGDTLSYTLAYNGTINPTNTQSRLNVMNHHYSQSITAAAALDIENKTLRFHYNKIGKVNGRIWVPTSVHHGTLLEIFNEIAQESQSKVVSVSYNINDGNGNGNWEYMNSHYGYVHRHGRRVEVPKDKANDYFQRLFAAIIEAGQTQDVFSCSLSRNDANIVFGKQWDGDVFCLRRLKDGRVFVLHVEKPDKPCDLAIPYNWHEVDSISRLKE